MVMITDENSEFIQGRGPLSGPFAHYGDIAVGRRKKRAAVYARKSHFTEGQSKSIADQVKDARRVCAKLGYDLDEDCIYLEEEGCKGDWWWPQSGMSGPHRPVLGKMITDMLAGKFDVIVIWKSDRLYRDCGVADAILKMMRQNDIAFVCGGYDYQIHTATGYARASLEAVTNREQRDKASEDVKRALEERVAEGKLVSNPNCLGFTSAGHKTGGVIPIPEELDLVRRIYRMYVIGEDPEVGPMNQYHIARTLIAEGIEMRRLRNLRLGPTIPITDLAITHILKNHAYIGEKIYRGKPYACDAFLVPASDGSGQLETAVPRELWQHAQEKRERQTKTDKRKDRTPHLLTGKMICGTCGRTLYPHADHIRAKCFYYCGNDQWRFQCPKTSSRIMNKVVVERWALEELAPLLVAEIEAARSADGRNADRDLLISLRRRMAEAEENEKTKLTTLYDVLDKEQFAVLATSLRQTREVLARQAKAIEERLHKSEAPLISIDLDKLAEMPVTALRAAFQSSIEWMAVTHTGIIVLTRMGSYIAARVQRGGKGYHCLANVIQDPEVVDALVCLSWLGDPKLFLQGLRFRLKDRAEGLSDEEIVPGITKFLDQDNRVEAAHVARLSIQEDTSPSPCK